MWNINEISIKIISYQYDKKEKDTQRIKLCNCEN